MADSYMMARHFAALNTVCTRGEKEGKADWTWFKKEVKQYRDKGKITAEQAYTLMSRAIAQEHYYYGLPIPSNIDELVYKAFTE